MKHESRDIENGWRENKGLTGEEREGSGPSGASGLATG